MSNKQRLYTSICYGEAITRNSPQGIANEYLRLSDISERQGDPVMAEIYRNYEHHWRRYE